MLDLLEIKKKQPNVSRCTAEAEYRSMVAAFAKIIWIIGLLGELGFPVSTPIPSYCDNKVAIQIASHLS